MIWRGHLDEATPTNLSLISVMLGASIVLNEATPTNTINFESKTSQAHGVCDLFCLFVDTKTSSLSETGQFMSSTYYVPVRNRKILASTYLTNESVPQGAKKSRLFKFFRSIETTI